MSERSQKIAFTNRQGQRLAARLDLPARPPRAFALFAHCFTCSKDIFAASRVSQGLAAEDVAVLRFDFTGLGASKGEFANTNFSSNVEDLVAAADFLRQAHQAPALLIGHSLGGAAVLAAAEQVPEAVAVVTIGAPFDPAHVAHHFAPVRAEIEARGEAEVTLAGRTFRIKKHFLDDIAQQKQAERIGRLKKALLIFHAPRDETVGIDAAGAIFQAAKHPKSFVSLDDADHLLTRRADAVYVAQVLAAWASRFLPPASAAEVAPVPARGEGVLDVPSPAPGDVVVNESGQGRFTQTVRVGSHVLTADEPTDVPGGLDSGPGPYDLLLAGLGACTSMTLRLYAERKKLPLERVIVRLSHEKIHATDCEDCETRDGKLDQIERTLELGGTLDEATRQRLLEIADKCPVHRTLTSEVVIRTKLVE